MTDPRTAPIDQRMRRSLRALIDAGKVIKGDRDYFSADGTIRIPLDLARRMKERHLASATFTAGEMVPTERGRRIAGENDVAAE